MNRKLQFLHLFISAITFLLVIVILTEKGKTLFDFNKAVSKTKNVPSVALPKVEARKLPEYVEDKVIFEVYNGSDHTICSYLADIMALDKNRNILWKRKTKGSPWNSTSSWIFPYSSKQVYFYFDNTNVMSIEAKIVEYEIEEK